MGDVHGRHDRLDTVLGWLAPCDPDLALLVGDIGLDPPWGRSDRRRLRQEHDESVRGVVRRVRSALGCAVVFVPGNHDLPDPPDDVDGINVDRRVIILQGLRIAGLGGSGPALFGFPYEWSEEVADAVLGQMFPEPRRRLDLWLCHAPPARTRLDRTTRGEHVGSRAVARWIGVLRPRLFVCGHIHESAGLEWLDGVPCVNAGSLGEPHGREIACTVDWSDGPARVEALVTGPDGDVERRVWHPAG